MGHMLYSICETLFVENLGRLFEVVVLNDRLIGFQTEMGKGRLFLNSPLE
jgi:hypothetical protein